MSFRWEKIDEELSGKTTCLLTLDKIGVATIQKMFYIGYAKAAGLVDILIDEGCFESEDSRTIVSTKFKTEIHNLIYDYMIKNK